MFTTYLSIGGNLGDRLSNLKRCVELIAESIGDIQTKSSVYETKAWGNENQPDFFNIAISVETALDPYQLLEQIHDIELKLGRNRLQHWGERTIDIDILFYDEMVIKTDKLTIPHPLIQERMFVLEPLNEIFPKFIHPILKKSVKELYKECKDKLSVRKLNEKI